MADIIIDTFKLHQSKAGKKGGRSRSPAKVAAARANLAKVRARRHNPVTGPQVGEKVGNDVPSSHLQRPSTPKS